MWQRFTITDFRIILHYLGMLVLGSSILTIPSIICALIFNEWGPLARYFTTFGICLILGSALRLFCINPEKLNRRQAIAVTALAWIVLSILASLPLYFSGHYTSYLDSVFDAVSAFTTTGASLIYDLEHISNADNMMRFMMHLAGGLGLIVVALSLGIFGKSTGASLFTSEGRSEHVLPNIVLATRFITKLTTIIIAITTIILFFIIVNIGLEPARAILHAFWIAITCFVTGGLAPMSESIMYYNSMPLEFVAILVMLLGTVSFTLYFWIIKGKISYFFSDLEIKTGCIWLTIMSCIFAATVATSPYFNTLPEIIHRGLFMIIAAFSTTGLTVITQSQLVNTLSSGAFLILILVMAIGGSAGSTAGGIKFDRIGIIAKSIMLSIKQAVAPDSAKVTMSYYHAGRKNLDSETVKNVMTIFILFITTYALGALAGISHGYDASLSLFESVALASNSGLTSGVAAPGMPWTLETVYIILMWAGRLEFLALLSFVAQLIASIKPKKKQKS